MARPDETSSEADEPQNPDATRRDTKGAGASRTGQQALGGNDLDQERRGASVDEATLTKGERRRGGQDVS